MTDAATPPPFVAKETEQLVLGASMVPGSAHAQFFVAQGLTDAHFFSHHHRLIWRSVSKAVREGIEPHVQSVGMLLARSGDIEEVGLAYFSHLPDGIPRLTAPTMEAMARRLVECYVGREALRLLRASAEQLADKQTLLVDGFFSRIDVSLRSLSAQLAGRRVPDHVAHVSEVMGEVREALNAGSVDFIDTPWPELNSMLGGGFAPGELVYLGARPGVGKTAAALEIGRRAAKRGRSVLMFSREMRRVAIGMRMVAQEGPVNATVLRKRSIDAAQWRTIDLAMEDLSALPFFITHAKVDITDMQRIVGLLADEGPLGLVIVDYLQLIDAPAGVEERRLQVEAVSKVLKAITIDHNVTVLCLSSLSRPPENRAPTLASLRESGNLEHDADTVIFFHRPEELSDERECIVAKARDGRTGGFKMRFHGPFLRFEELYVGSSGEGVDGGH